MNRQSIFISHARPEDNEFVRWLGARLELEGFSVWHDLNQLKGGDHFWDKIEKAIREESFRFLAVISKISLSKQGVKDEWGLAQAVEKSLQGFVIPIQIDDYNPDLLPISIIRKNVINFTGSWHKGLVQLVDTLVEANTPKVSDPDPVSVRHWLPQMKDDAILKTQTKESLDSTWLRIYKLPPSLETARILGREHLVPLTDENRHMPWFEHEGRIVGFAKSEDIVTFMANSVMLKPAKAVVTDGFIESGSTLGDKMVAPHEARRYVVNLVRQAWELAMEAKGFGIHEQSGRRKVFYVTASQTGGRGKQVQFEDFDGRKRRKSLNGRSEKRKANWAYAVGIIPVLDEPQRVELRSTIVFLDDDEKPMESATRAHRLRMSFCRSWWNDRWRGFLRAFLALASDGQSEIRLPVGSDRYIVLSSTPIAFFSPVGLSDGVVAMDIDPVDEPDDDLDEIDDHEEEGDEL